MWWDLQNENRKK
jgi:hypothetical protein